MKHSALVDRVRDALARRFFVALKRATHRMPVRLETPLRRRVLVVAPHMDDEAIACGGTLLLHRELGSEVRVAFVSDSSTGARDPALADRIRAIRHAEMEQVAAALGLAGVVEFGFPDGALVRHETAIAERLADLLRDFTPDEVFCPFPVDAHADHQAVALATARAARLAGWRGEIVAYEVWSALWPNRAVDIGAVAGQKAALIGLYASQMGDRDYAGAILGLNRYRGLAHRVAYAEAFHRCSPAAFAALTARLDRLDASTG